MMRRKIAAFSILMLIIPWVTASPAAARSITTGEMLIKMCGTWVDTAYGGDKTYPQKIVFKPDGTFETYNLASQESPSERGDFTILESWRDFSNCMVCRATTKSIMSSAAARELWRIDASGRKWESCFTFTSKSFAEKIDSHPDSSGPYRYSIYSRLSDAPSVSIKDNTNKEDYTRYTYTIADGKPLNIYVFQPAKTKDKKPRPAIVFFHGGGWVSGEPAWAFSQARHFASLGMVAAAVQYRLSDQITITPLEAMADTRASMRWLRSNAKMLGINVKKVAAYGWSAGGHLAASLAIFQDTAGREEVNSSPDALILVSPAVHLDNETWLQQLLGARANNSSVSPASHVRKGLPPTLVLEGRHDTITPLKDVQVFCDRMRAAGNRCDLQIYEGVGHLFTPDSLSDKGWPRPDKKIQSDALKKADEFLVKLGFIR
jgi:acetyl esterase